MSETQAFKQLQKAVQEEDMPCVPEIHMFWCEMCLSTSEQKPCEDVDWT